ncbi:MAG: hypothetical protein DMD81_11525 [Candidatus Rokuibacteriota bacterium]|nr:MAG: hypothetical protein DMD81_11525 [Candidatus Rokubacteria bacterium]
MLDYIRTVRSMIGTTKIIVPGVRALIFNDRGELLLQKQQHFGSWSLPHGCMDLGESVLDALKREVKEETGLSVIDAAPFGIYTDPRYSVTYPNGDQVQTLTLAFVVTEWSGDPVADGDETTELGFFPLDRLPTPLYPIHVDTIVDYQSNPRGFVLK